MKALDLAPLPSASERETPLRDRIEALVDRWMTSDALYRWSVANPLTRWVTRIRARKVFDLMAGFVYSQVLLACVRLRILETVAERPRTLDELAQATQLPAAGCSACCNRPWRCNYWKRAAGAALAWARWAHRWPATREFAP
jgi:demethylspheroidene O-methyltransferase